MNFRYVKLSLFSTYKENTRDVLIWSFNLIGMYIKSFIKDEIDLFIFSLNTLLSKFSLLKFFILALCSGVYFLSLFFITGIWVTYVPSSFSKSNPDIEGLILTLIILPLLPAIIFADYLESKRKSNQLW